MLTEVYCYLSNVKPSVIKLENTKNSYMLASIMAYKQHV